MSSTGPSSARTAELLGAGIFVLFAALLFLHPAAPAFTDYSNWTYQGLVLRAHWLGHAEPAHTIKLYPIPNSAATVGVALFTLIAPWAVAAKLWLLAQFAFSYFALRHLARTLSASGWVWTLVPAASFFGLNLWYGFVNFQLGVAWTLLFASLLLRRAKQPTLPVRTLDPALASTLVLAFFTHMIPAAFCGLLLVLFCRQTSRWRELANLVPLGLLTLWYALARFLLHGNADGQSGMTVAAPYLSRGFWLFKVNTVMKSFGFADPASLLPSLAGRPIFFALLAINAVLVALLAVLVFLALRTELRERRPEHFLWMGLSCMLPVCFLLPAAALGISDPGARLFQTLLAPLLVLLCVHPGRALAAAGLCAFMLLASSATLVARLATSPLTAAALQAQPAKPLPEPLLRFAVAPFDDELYFNDALSRRDLSLAIYPTGVLLNTPAATPSAHSDVYWKLKSPLPGGSGLR